KEMYEKDDSHAERDWAIRNLTWDYLDEEANKDWQIKDEPSARLVLKEINGYYTTQGMPPAHSAAAVTGVAGQGPVAATAALLGRPGEVKSVGLKDGLSMKTFGDLKDDGSTASGAWIYTGIYAPTTDDPGGHNFAANRDGDDWVSQQWGFSWPANRRILYNRCSADPDGRPWAKESRLARAFARAGGPEHR